MLAGTHLMPARAGSARGPRCKQARRGPSLSAQFDSSVSAAKTAATARATSATAAAIAATATTVGHAVHAGAHRVGLRAGRCRAQAIGIAEAAGRAKAGHGVVGAALLGSTVATTAIFATAPTAVTATLALRTALTLVRSVRAIAAATRTL